MTRWSRSALADESGGVSGMTLALLSLTLLVAALVVDIGAIRVQRLRFVDALEQAAVVAAGHIDAGHLAATGKVRLADTAAGVAREYLRLNLQPLDRQIAGTTATAVAGAAEIAVTNPGGIDPIRNRTAAAPTVSIRAEVPVRTGLLRLAGLSNTQALRVAASAMTRS
ncbi:MAG: hypothetical protein OXG79_04625 [Chloroflexi bacterium]|nr:hypothetical protein [Chloroflexota bacterium]